MAKIQLPVTHHSNKTMLLRKADCKLYIHFEAPFQICWDHRASNSIFTFGKSAHYSIYGHCMSALQVTKQWPLHRRALAAQKPCLRKARHRNVHCACQTHHNTDPSWSLAPNTPSSTTSSPSLPELQSCCHLARTQLHDTNAHHALLPNTNCCLTQFLPSIQDLSDLGLGLGLLLDLLEWRLCDEWHWGLEGIRGHGKGRRPEPGAPTDVVRGQGPGLLAQGTQRAQQPGQLVLEGRACSMKFGFRYPCYWLCAIPEA